MFPSFNIPHRCIFVIALVCSSICFHTTQGSASQEPFPIYPSIKDNVAFWKQVYAKYPSTKGLIHDSDDLSIIYEVASLRPANEQGSRRANKEKIKQVKAKYRQILKELAKGRPAATEDQKKVVALFGSKGGPAVWKEASENVRFQLCLSDRFQDGVVRSGRYIIEMKNIFRSHGLPVDLVYLPHVESSFNYKAYSKFGAAGIWQFIRSTGRRFMTVGYALDERRDPILATHAAAKYLKKNYALLGNWPMAITAYNHGGNSILRAKNKHGNYERIFKHYENRRFGFASRNFYSEFIAAREVAKNHRTYFKGLKLDKKIITFNVKMAGYVSVDSIISHFAVDEDTIQNLNPALRHPVFTGQKYIPKGYTLKLPDKTDRRLAHIPASLYKQEQKRSRFYRVERGDTAGKIARMHKVRLRDLIDINQLSRRATIYMGQNLRIPTPGEVQRLSSQATASPAAQPHPVSETKTRPAKEIVTASLKNKSLPGPLTKQHKSASQASPSVEKSPAPPGSKQTAQATATTGQKPLAAPKINTINKQEKKPPASPSQAAMPQLARLESHNEPLLILPALDMKKSHTAKAPTNGTNGDIALEQSNASAAEINPEIVVGNFQVEKVYKKKGKNVGVVQVEYLETLGHYADWLEIPTQHIRLLNGFSFRRHIKAHQKIEVPMGKVSKDLFEERRYEFHKEIEEDFFAAYKVVSVESYSIKRGDNIWSLCREELDLPFWLIKKYNPALDVEALMPNQQLVVPIVEKIS